MHQSRLSQKVVLVRLGWLVAVIAALVVPAAPAYGHSAGASALVLDVGADRVVGELHLPVDQLARATGLDAARELTPDQTAALGSYLRPRLSAHGSAGPWVTELGSPRPSVLEGQRYLRVPLVLTPPDGDTSDFRLDADVIVREVRTHDIQVYVGGRPEDADARPLGTLNYATTSLTLAGPRGDGFGATVRAGAEHVLDGPDHLLFVAMLLLPAPLVARAGRWRSRHRRGVRASVLRSGHVVTAFTVGHSLTLVTVTLTGVDAASRWLEVLVAASVVVSAGHAIRPLVSGGEIWLAGVFGLVHGAAFAGLLRDLGTGAVPDWTVLLAFNLGVELAQLLVVAALLPPLLVLADGRHYRYARVVLAVAGGVVATSWLIERATATTNPLQPVTGLMTTHLWLVALAIAAVAAIDWSVRSPTALTN